MIKKTKFYSKIKGKMPKGCRLCVKGQKLVLFITGICPNRCYFCPLSEKKFNKDVVFADEWKITNLHKPKEIIKEAKLIKAKGAGITGGDPLTRTNRCVNYIKLLKKHFGKKFHIHLYTSLTPVNEQKLKQLHSAGLDEIRFHADLDRTKLWNKIKTAKKYNWDIGIEIPAVPGKQKQIKKLIDFAEKNKIKFINLNELEFSDTKIKHYNLKKYKKKNNLTYAVKGSEELADKLLKYSEKKKISVYYCSAKLKDSVQLKKRIIQRAKSTAKKFDYITGEGMITRGIIYGNTKKTKNILLKNKIPKNLFSEENKTIITSLTIAYELKDKLKKAGLKIAIIEQYPTTDKFIVDKIYL